MGIKLAKQGEELIEGSKIKLQKDGDAQLKQIAVGCGWDPVRGTGRLDIDLSAVSFDENGNHLDSVWFGSQKKTTDPIYAAKGDNLTGEGDGDDEVIRIHLDRVAANVKHIVIAINSYTGQTFQCLSNAYARLVNEDNQPEVQLAYLELNNFGPYRGLAMVRIYRHNGEWKVATINKGKEQAQTVSQMISFIKENCLS